ncbi:MAG: tetraacyldisaccharide 4-kinase [Bacteroidota bacterium]|jgi:tetraacyldisaccharide 4'-kinase
MRRLALYPFALIYGAAIWLRNRCFDLQILRTQAIAGKSICIGNIAVGGTGKSPLVGYLIEQLSEAFQVQVLSRGYGRKTSGFILLDATKTPREVGDESCMLYAQYHQQAQFAVCENRHYGVQRLRSTAPESILLLDDAFQHRWVRAGLNLVLSTHEQPLHHDALLPAGNLREQSSGLMRADALIITKCPPFDTFDPTAFAKQFQKWNIPVFFSRYAYKPLMSLTYALADIQDVLLVSAIAKPGYLDEAFGQNVRIQHISYPDHHAYTQADLNEIHHFFDTFATTNSAIVTTAKDWIKIQSLLSAEDRQKYPWYLLTFELQWLDQAAFNQFISAYVDSN